MLALFLNGETADGLNSFKGDFMEEILEYYQELHDFLGTSELCQGLFNKFSKIMQKALENIPTNARIGIRGAGVHTKVLLNTLQLSDKNIIGIFDQAKLGDALCGYPLYPASELRAKAPEYIIISNFFYREEIKEELSDFTVPIIDFYDELEKEGIKLRFPFYMYTPESPLTLGYFYWNYEDRKCEETLREFLQAALEQKDFILISNVYKENGGADGQYPILIAVWDQVQILLQMIHDKLQARKQKDIVLLWTDAVSYQDLNYMPKTKRRITKEGCFFQRAYTTTSYTNATLRAMFRGTLPIDDYPDMEQPIDRTNSPLLQYLEENGYRFRCYADPETNVHSNYLRKGLQLPNTIIWWNALQSLLKQEQPCFYLLQFVTESHSPGTYPLQERFYKDAVDNIRSPEVEKHQRDALAYLDQCIALYQRLLDNKTQILLSDHGCHWNDKYAWAETRIHAYCFVKGEDIPVVQVSKLFSYKNFSYLIRWIIDPEHNKLEDATSNEVLIQDTDYYSAERIADMIRFKIPKHGVAYRGIQTEEYKYIITSLGDEYFYIFKNGEEIQMPLEDEALRSELRGQCGTYFLDIRTIDRFRHSRALYEEIRRIDPESSLPLWAAE